ncbi:hypothetical protein HK104_001579, partial [Borealophlyctis nickersoniae]
VYIISNEAMVSQFRDWAGARGVDVSHIVSDGTVDNASRLGAVADLDLAVERFGFRERGENVLVVAGDTLFLRDFDVGEFVRVARTEVGGGSLVTACAVSEEGVRKVGILELEGGGKVRRVVGLLEKPDPKDTPSRVACPCFYYLRPEALRLVSVFLDERRKVGAGLNEVDATGKFISWLLKRHPVRAMPISGRLDIGGLASYIEAEKYMSEGR